MFNHTDNPVFPLVFDGFREKVKMEKQKYPEKYPEQRSHHATLQGLGRSSELPMDG